MHGGGMSRLRDGRVGGMNWWTGVRKDIWKEG
jgi:hypothetical protein